MGTAYKAIAKGTFESSEVSPGKGGGRGVINICIHDIPTRAKKQEYKGKDKTKKKTTQLEGPMDGPVATDLAIHVGDRVAGWLKQWNCERRDAVGSTLGLASD